MAKITNTGPVKARVIFAGEFGAVDDVVTVSKEDAQAGVERGELDCDPGAVAYAESLKAQSPEAQ